MEFATLLSTVLALKLDLASRDFLTQRVNQVVYQIPDDITQPDQRSEHLELDSNKS